MFGDFVDVIDCGADHNQGDNGQYGGDREFREELAAGDLFAFAECSAPLKEGTVILLVAILLDRFFIVIWRELWNRESSSSVGWPAFAEGEWRDGEDRRGVADSVFGLVKAIPLTAAMGDIAADLSPAKPEERLCRIGRVASLLDQVAEHGRPKLRPWHPRAEP